MKVPKNHGYFKKLYEDHYSDLISFATAILFDRNQAYDIVQEVFMYLWDNADNINIEKNIRNYLFTSVKFKSLNHIKHIRIIDTHSERIKEAYLFSEIIDPELEDEKLQRIFLAMEDLPEQMRRVFILHTLDKKKYNDIATELNISVNTVKTHLRRAFKALRSRLLIIFLLL